MAKPWIKHPTILKGRTIDLLPLKKEHFDELFAAASDKKLWGLIPTDCSQRDRFDKAYSAALTERKKGKEYPFVVYHKTTKKIIGSTRLFEIFPEHRKLEIGWTWITAEYWGTVVNPECKFLLLQFCFGELHAIRVQLKTDELNIRSRRAIEKIGAKFEGIWRKDKIKENGMPRSAAYYSIIDDEWAEVKGKLQAQFGNIYI